MSLQRKLNQRERMAYDTIARLEQERDALCAQVGTLTELHANALNKVAERDALRSKLAQREALLRNATSRVQRMVECAGSQPSVATGYLRDILELLNGSAEPIAPVERDEQELFESVFPVPSHTTKFKGGYAATEFNAWDAQKFCDRWDGWKARAALERQP